MQKILGARRHESPVVLRHGSVRHNEKKHRASVFFRLSVLSVGIEPTLQVPQTCVLSIERREDIFYEHEQR